MWENKKFVKNTTFFHMVIQTMLTQLFFLIAFRKEEKQNQNPRLLAIAHKYSINTQKGSPATFLCKLKLSLFQSKFSLWLAKDSVMEGLHRRDVSTTFLQVFVKKFNTLAFNKGTTRINPCCTFVEGQSIELFYKYLRKGGRNIPSCRYFHQ